VAFEIEDPDLTGAQHMSSVKRNKRDEVDAIRDLQFFGEEQIKLV
jgi:hypothetical protein